MTHVWEEKKTVDQTWDADHTVRVVASGRGIERAHRSAISATWVPPVFAHHSCALRRQTNPPNDTPTAAAHKQFTKYVATPSTLVDVHNGENDESLTLSWGI
ncbi:hypothetical protein G7K_2896-t1 [Saitoella complicata NRRL Y-17804]|uniref:Uncharacterized protein n=1 Tax=Saitoella complicata (strain BCRC 22490 / CBS 7301 / JCM 7358 / NBRC 10748 / NRRL Y-17804) TaxID=698492 RepID=A0A0E9NG96_SAICN|nr:hypothetical protein G7K_2896-t1 [Saitoella complicata NRRL Y-17804]